MQRTIFCFLLFIILVSCTALKRSDRAAERMQNFVIDISRYVKKQNNNFILIPQNGVELVFNNADIHMGFNTQYMQAIDGIAVEELYYNGKYLPDHERISMLRKIKSYKKILVSEYVEDDRLKLDAYMRNQNEGFICFVRTKKNYDYICIPDTIPNENALDINSLSDARNFLYLINSNNFSSKKEIIQSLSATNFDVIILDLFFQDTAFTKSEIEKLKRKANGAKRVVLSYINIGAAEKFRYYWKKSWGLHHPLWIKKKYEGYDDEFWVKFWKKNWQQIIYGTDDSYMRKILSAGFDGAYLDNVEAYYFLYYD
ncbi:MAG: endo alpha-1,4 polygalactosaminidase [Cytophagaceae bacterium]|nr:endo alpha-1,4 polygalactosaminidase [Cytophagaceae bacterium]MDW8457265.1 endo alpha-1,4 polygalactosaminidase [Cytophagaceae bacterium]